MNISESYFPAKSINVICFLNEPLKHVLLIFVLFFFASQLRAQKEDISKTQLVFGLSSPELFHAGVTYRISNISKIGLSGGAGPSWGVTFTTISFENRLYFGKNSERSGQKTYFFRQGASFFPVNRGTDEDITLNLSIGKDALFKNIKTGITIDAGIFIFPRVKNISDGNLSSQRTVWPVLRFQFYFSI